MTLLVTIQKPTVNKEIVLEYRERTKSSVKKPTERVNGRSGGNAKVMQMWCKAAQRPSQSRTECWWVYRGRDRESNRVTGNVQ